MESRRTKFVVGLWRPLVVALVVIAGIGLIVAINPAVLSVALPDLSARLDGLSGDPLAAEKLRREIIALELANRLAGSPWAPVLAVVPLATALLAGLGLFVTVRREQVERADRESKERNERDAEHQRQANESFRTTVQNLSADQVALRASAAVSLGTFLRPEYKTFYDDVLLVSLAKAKKGMENDRIVQRLVVRALEAALRLRLHEIKGEQRRYFVDFSDCELSRIDLSGLDLTEADLGFAVLSHANLSESNLRRARGIEVTLEHARLGRANLNEARLNKAKASDAQFHEINGVSMRLEGATLVQAEFYRAKLQEAHFNHADLSGAKFQGADINNAYFTGATLDEAALTSIAKGALNWDKAHFDKPHLAFLREVVAVQPPPNANDVQPRQSTSPAE